MPAQREVMLPIDTGYTAILDYIPLDEIYSVKVEITHDQMKHDSRFIEEICCNKTGINSSCYDPFITMPPRELGRIDRVSLYSSLTKPQQQDTICLRVYFGNICRPVLISFVREYLRNVQSPWGIPCTLLMRRDWRHELSYRGKFPHRQVAREEEARWRNNGLRFRQHWLQGEQWNRDAPNTLVPKLRSWPWTVTSSIGGFMIPLCFVSRKR